VFIRVYPDIGPNLAACAQRHLPPDDPVIEADKLTKEFRDRRRAKVRAADEVSFVAKPGEVFGLLGPNGAGKTTTMRMLSTAVRATSGTARIDGVDVGTHPEKARSRFGFLAAGAGLYGRLTPREVLRFFGRLYGMSDADCARRTAELACLFAMNDFLDRPCDKLSTGMKQKTNIARAVFHAPPVMMFDEPTTGLDVLTSRTIVQFVRRCREEGRTVLLSTHIMSEVEKLCDRVAIIHRGRVRFQGTVPELRAGFGHDLEDAFAHLVGEEDA